MYIPDSANNRIRMVNPSGIISTFAGTGVVGYTGDGAAANQALLWSPSGVTVDPAGNVYIADTQNNAVRKVNSATGYISTIVRSGVGEFLQNGGFNNIGIYGPMGLSFDGNGNLFFADYFNMVIREVQGNFVAFDLTKTPVRQGDQSATQYQEIENDGNAALDLTSIAPDSNAAVNATYTTCTTGTPLLAVAADCQIGAAFAPSPLNPPTDPETGNIDIAVDIAAGLVATNSPLDIQLIGNATAVNSTTVVVTSNNNPSAFGQSVTFTATVSTGATSGNLTGTVTFIDGTATLKSAVALNSAGTTVTATFATSSLAVGLHSITASYNGDAGHFTSTSKVLVQTVGEATVTALVSSANPSAVGASVTFTATVTPSNGGSVTPDGTVVFSDGATILAGVALNASGVATFSTSTLTNGLHSITAAYGGDAANQILASTSPVLSQEVLAASSATLTSAPNPSYYGGAITMTITVIPSGAAAATGVVNILDSGMQIGQVTLVGTTGSGIFTTSSLAIGSHTITAAYQGSSFYAVSTSPPITQVVNQATTATTVSATPNPGIAGAAETLTATVTVTAGSGTPTGTVSFTDGTTPLGSSLIGVAGTFTIKTTLTPGAHSIVATYSGDTNDVGSASAPYPLTVQLATTAVTTFTSTPNPSIADSAVTFTAIVTGNGGIPTGSINFVANGTSIGTANLDATGTATFAYSGFGAGTYSMVAIYSGDALDSTSTSAALSQVVGTIPTVTALGYSSTNGTNPQVILVATVVASSGPPSTGTITFTSGSTTLGTAALDSSGVATLTPNLAVGSYSIVASYGGDVAHSPSTSPAVTISIPATGFSLAVTPASITLATSQNATVSVILTSNNGYTDTIELGCSSLPAGVTCHFASLGANLAANTVQTVQLTIDTNNPLSGGGVASTARDSKRSMEQASLFLPLSLFFGWIFWRFRKRNLAGLTIMLLLACALLVTGCSGITMTGVPPGTYPIQVTGIGANSGISQYQNVTLTITK
jgi:hypothetical protein